MKFGSDTCFNLHASCNKKPPTPLGWLQENTNGNP